jgi:Homing endonuclease associated repeat/HNH endonuclease
MAQFQVRLRRRNIPDAEILDDMRRVAQDLGALSLTAIQYDERGSFGSTTALRRFKTWNQALGSAGLAVSNRQHIPNDELFENIVNVWTKLGEQPLGRHMSDKGTGSKFSTGTYEKRFGSWNKALLAFSDFISLAESVSDIPQFLNEGAAESNRRSLRRTPRNVNWRLRARVLIRDACICRMCGDSPAKNPECTLHSDHIIAWANGGETVEENLQTLCAKCNIGKSDQLLPGQDPP